ncbi:MAG: amino acid permease [Myxococcota bacterium]
MTNDTQKIRLHRHLGLLDVFCISAGAMISSGLFILPGIAFGLTGPSMFLAYLIAGLLTIPALLSKAELATAMPRAGGVYFYIDRSMGTAMGTLGGLAAWFSLSFKSAFALIGMGAFIALLLPGLSDFELRLVAAGCCAFFVALNLLGAKHAGQAQIVMVMGLLVVLTIYIIAGLEHVDTTRFRPFQTGGIESFVATIGLVFVSFGGLTKVASVAEEVKNPGRNIVLGMMLAFGIVLGFYVAVTVVTIGLVDGAALAETLTPINLGAEVSMGSAGVAMVAIAAILAFVSTANAGIMAASRVPMAMSRDLLLPSTFDQVHEKRGTPTLAVLATGGSMIAVILLLDLEGLIKTASMLKLMLFLLVNVAVIVMRESRLQNYRPSFKSPLYPWIQLLGIISSTVLIAAMGLTQIAIASGFVAMSLAWYAIYGRRKRLNSASALIHLVERIAGRDLTSGSLGSELSEIIRERDDIGEDRFDRLVQNCLVLDLEGPTELEDFVREAADHMAERVNLSEDHFVAQLMERERDTSTALTPTLAIPHAVIEGESRFEMLIARCKKGVNFSEKAPKVQTIFVLIGSQDERNFHLQALMAIAQVAQEPKFHERWLRANDGADLKDLLLLSRRARRNT